MLAVRSWAPAGCRGGRRRVPCYFVASRVTYRGRRHGRGRDRCRHARLAVVGAVSAGCGGSDEMGGGTCGRPAVPGRRSESAGACASIHVTGSGTRESGHARPLPRESRFGELKYPSGKSCPACDFLPATVMKSAQQGTVRIGLWSALSKVNGGSVAYLQNAHGMPADFVDRRCGAPMEPSAPAVFRCDPIAMRCIFATQQTRND
jgi:hypothetical protein